MSLVESSSCPGVSLDAYRESAAEGHRRYAAALDRASALAAFDRVAGCTVFVIGCSGMLGTAVGEILARVVERLGPQAPRVIGLARHRRSWPQRLDWVAGDVTDPATLKQIARSDYCLHVAGPTGDYLDRPGEALHANTTGLVHALEAGCGSRGFVYVSSARVYGRQLAERASEETQAVVDAMSLDNIYDSAKRWAEAYCLWAHQRRGWPATVARCSNVYGPHPSAGHALAGFVRELWAAHRVAVRGAARSERSYCAAPDAAMGLLLAMVAGRRGIAYNIGSDERWTTRALAQHLASLAPFPVEVAIEGGRDGTRILIDPGRATRELECVPVLTLGCLGAAVLEWDRPAAVERGTA